jgi:hypothetical protein
MSTPPVEGQLTLSVTSRSVTPGETVVVTGRYAGQRPAGQSGYANLCWDGCQTGLQEQGVTLHWVSSTTFQADFEVPGAPWFEGTTRKPSIHPLASGNYSLGIECVAVSSGCALGPADAETIVHLAAPAPTRCANGRPCASLTLGTTKAQVGDVVRLSGWAPLETIIGPPFGYNLSVASATKDQKYGGITYTRTAKGGGFSVMVDPRALKVAPALTWADLGKVHYLTSTWSGLSSVSPLSGSNLTAWCQPSRILITGGATKVSVPTSGVVAIMKDLNLELSGSPPAHPQCSTVMLDPRFPDVVYAGFEGAPGGIMPPEDLAGLYTTDLGAQWRAVPAPPGLTPDDFAGFVTVGSRVEAMFTTQYSYANTPLPEGPITVEVLSEDGASWSVTTLGCPGSGPCATFGPLSWGNCAMNGSNQALLLRAPGSTPGSAVRWTTSSWVVTVNNCFTQQLVATSSRGLMLLDPSSQYPLLESTDSGLDWNYVELPPLDGVSVGSADNWGDSLTMAPNGTLFATTTSSSGEQKKLFLLAPGSSAWCQVPKLFSKTSSQGSTVTLRVNDFDLLWSRTVYNATSSPPSSIDARALSSLHC